MALAVWTEPALARSYLNCLTKKVVIVDAPRGSASSTIEENLGFWIDEAAKTLVLADGTPLTVRRFDDGWISAARGDISYEFDRQNGNLTYASSTTKEGAATIVIGSGRCKIAVGPAGQAGCTGRPTIVEASAMTHRLLALYKLRGSRFTTLPTLGEITGAAIMTGSSGASHARHGRSRPTGRCAPSAKGGSFARRGLPAQHWRRAESGSNAACCPCSSPNYRSLPLQRAA